MRQWIRYGTVFLVGATTLIAGNHVADYVTMQASAEFYRTQHYSPDRDIQFSPAGLQDYTDQAVMQAASAGRIAQGAIVIIGGMIIFAVLSAPDRASMQRLQQRFKDWQKAVKTGDNHAIAQIELEIQDERGNS